MKYTILLALLLVACSPAQLARVPSYLSTAASILDMGARVAESIAKAQEAGVGAKEEAVRRALTDAEQLVYDGVALVDGNTAEARYEAVSKLSEAIATLDALDPVLPQASKQLREEAKAILISRVSRDLDTVYALPVK